MDNDDICVNVTLSFMKDLYIPVFPGPSADANSIFASECPDTALRAECIHGGCVGLVCAQAPQVLAKPAKMHHRQEDRYNQTIKPKGQ